MKQNLPKNKLLLLSNSIYARSDFYWINSDKKNYVVTIQEFTKSGHMLDTVTKAKFNSWFNVELYCNMLGLKEPIKPDTGTKRNGIVYFISDGTHIKIGYTEMGISTRLNQLQTSCPNKLSVLKTIEGDFQYEKSLHKKFKKYHKLNEWYYLSDEIKEYIKKLS